MEHVIAYLRDDVRRESRRGDFLYAALVNYAPHALHDIDRKLAQGYPRARTEKGDDNEYYRS
jgi:hypothetical protein